jgi:HEAT repeat protein
LIRALNDSNSWAQLSAAHALGMFGTNAQSAIPSLTAIAGADMVAGTGIRSGNLNANAMQVRFEAHNALKKINPQAVPPQSEPFEFGGPGADWSLPTQ